MADTCREMKTLLVFCLLTVSAAAQFANGRYDDIALGPKGPIPHAFVAFCSQPANTSVVPCTPIIAVCSSLTDVVCSSPNPVTADELGNYHAYVPLLSQPFTVQIFGPQVAAPYVLIDQQTAGGGGGGSGGITPCPEFTVPYYSIPATAAVLGCIPLFANFPNGVPQTIIEVPAAGVLTTEQPAFPGVAGRAVLGATDTVVSTDCNPNRVQYSGTAAVAVTLPTATTLGVPKCVFRLSNKTSGPGGDLTVTSTTWTCNGSSTCLIHKGQLGTFYVDPNSMTNWSVDIGDGSGGTLAYLPCQTGIGDGLNAIPAGTYLQSFCFNDSGMTLTITGIRCQTDNSGTSTLTVTDNLNAALLTGPITCTPSYAAGTQSATVAILNHGYAKFTFISDGTSKQTTWTVTE